MSLEIYEIGAEDRDIFDLLATAFVAGAYLYFIYFSIAVDFNIGVNALMLMTCGIAIRLFFNLSKVVGTTMVPYGGGEEYFVLFMIVWIVVHAIMSQFGLLAYAKPKTDIRYIIAVILIAVPEEMFYNFGIFYPCYAFLRRGVNEIEGGIIALIVTGVFFYFIHVWAYEKMWSYIIARIVLCVAYWVSGRISIPLALHLFNNFLVVIGSVS